MDFLGPEAADFANVRALNHAFLLRLRDSRQGQTLRQPLPADVAQLVQAMTNLQIERLALSPFLLLSLRERDENSWYSLESNQETLDLFSNATRQSDELLMTAVSFLWQLAGRNPYAARLVSGATLGWCERLADCTLLHVLRTAAERDGLMQARFATDGDFWRKLLGSGLSSEERVRHSAHVTCLQWLLTDDPDAHYRPMRSAACENPIPTLSVAEKPRPR